MTTKVEEQVIQLNKLRKRANEIEGAMRRFRLGADVETVDDRPLLRRIRWRAMVFGGGWTSQTAEPFPEAVTQDFYDFLREREKKVWQEIRAIEADLESADSETGARR